MDDYCFDAGKKGASMARILISDGHSIYRTSLHTLVTKRVPRAEVVEACNHIECFSRIRYDEVFDLVLMHIDLPGLTSLKALKSACDLYPTTRFAIVSASDSLEVILASLAAGFHGFISKHQSDDETITAIKELLLGRIYVPWSLAEASDRVDRI